MEETMNEESWFTIQDTVKEDFLSTLQIQEIIQLVKMLDVKIPGFNRKLHKAPSQLLKNNFTKKLMQIHDLRDFLKVYSLPYSKDFEDITYEELLRKLAPNNDITTSEIIAVISCLFPEKYMALREQLFHNIEKNVHPLEGIVEVSLTDTLKHLPNKFTHVIEEIKDGLESLFTKLETSNHLSFDTYEDYFQKDYDIEIAPALYVLTKQEELEEVLTKEEKLELNNLALLELAYHYQSKKKKWEKERGKLEREAEKTEKQLKEEQKHNEQLQEELEKKEIELEKAKKEVALLQKKIKEKEKQEILLMESDPFLLFTNRQSDFQGWIDSTRVKPLSELKDSIKHPSQANVSIMIDVFSLSTKEKIQMKDQIKAWNGYARLLNGSVSSIMKKIIYLLEGENTNETDDETNN